MRKIEQELVALFLEYPEKFLTSHFLAEQLLVSEKTIRTLIKEMNTVYGEIFQIQGHKGQGYLLQVYDEPALAYLCQQTLLKPRISDSTIDRERYILSQLFFENEFITLEEIVQNLFISLSTVSKLLTHLRVQLKKYKLSLKRTQELLFVQGEERDKRRFIMDYFLAEEINHTLFGYQEIVPVFTDVNVKELYRSILEVCREEKMRLSDFALTNLLVHLSLAIKRMKLGHCVERIRFEDSHFHQQTEAVSHKMIERISQYTGIHLPKEEASYITLHLLGKGRGQSGQISRKEAVEKELKECIRHFFELMEVPLDSQDTVLLRGLQEHFGPLMLRLDNGISLDNPLYEEMLKDYGLLLERTKIAFSGFSIFREHTLSSHEWAYIALHLLAAIERREMQSHRRVLLVCATGFGSAQVLKNRIETYFGNRLDIVACVSVHELQEYDFSTIDFMISALDLSQYLYPRPVIEVSVLIGEEDIKRIESFINFTYKPSHQQGNQPNEQQRQLEEAVDVCLSENRFFYIDRKISKERVLSLLIDSLSDAKTDQFAQRMRVQLNEREELGSVVFSDYLAVPHPASALSVQEEVAVAICKTPLQWNQEYTEVQVVILISPSKLRNPHIQQLSQAVALFTQDIEAQQLLLENPTLSVLKTILKK